MEIRKGSKVHYTGDIANIEGDGEVVGVFENENLGKMVDVELEDGREFKRVFANNFKQNSSSNYKFELIH